MVNIEQLMRLENFFTAVKLDLAYIINSYGYKKEFELNQGVSFQRGYCTNRRYLAILVLGAFFAPIRADFSLKSPTLTSRKRLFCLFYVPFAPFQHNRAQ